MIQSGSAIGPYILVRTLGRGAFGEVWLAERHSSLLTIQVALKLPLDSAANIVALRQEARLWLKASGHTNIVPVLDAEVYNGQVVIASEYMAGGSLANWIVVHGGKAPSIDAAITMMRGILAGLGHLHANQLVHRDLKPENVLLQATTPRLTDFGLTRVLNATAHNTDPSGTPAYMAPEAFQGHYSRVSDVWAAGILLHEMLVGTLPYAHTDFYSLLMQIVSGAPLTFSEEIPRGIRPILSRALEKRPSDRYTSVEEMAEALAGIVTPHQPLVATRPRTGKDNLPIQATSFVGRGKEIAELKSLLSKTRLLALTGSGGCGKTRIALELAARVPGDYPDGVWLAELAPVTDATLITKTIADALKLRDVPGEPIATTLIGAIRERRLLLVLDNCEHLLDAVADLVDLVLRSCPDIRVLVSSREAIGIAGELVFRVPSLSLPDLKQAPTPGNLMPYESVSLFVERAVTAKPDFKLTEHNAPALATICRRLDGIPLAIELAAARTRFMTIEELAERLDDRFRILTGGSRTALPRQQTLRALIDWSYDLLDDKQKVLLNRLSVFVGGWTLEAAEKVCSGGMAEAWEILDLLTALHDKSLVFAEERGHTTRYRALETVRQYARDRLAETGESVATRDRHLDYYLSLAEEGEQHIRGYEQRQWLQRFEVEHDNIRSALEWSMQHADHAVAALRMTAALWWFWHIGGYLTEGRVWLALILAGASAQQRTALRASALNGAGNLARIQGDYAESRRLLEENLSIHRELNNKVGLANANNNLGLLAEAEGDIGRAREYYEQAVILNREAGSHNSGAMALSNLGALLTQLEELELARSYLEESLAISRGQGDLATMSGTLNNLGLVARSQGDYATARRFLTEAILVMQRLGYKVFIANTLGSLASLARAQDQWSRAVRLFMAMNSVRDALGARLPLPERQWVEGVLNELEAKLGEDGFAVAAAEGKAMDIDRAIEYATT